MCLRFIVYIVDSTKFIERALLERRRVASQRPNMQSDVRVVIYQKFLTAF